MGMRKALFLDRDGVINIEKKYVYRIADFEFMEGIFDILHFFQERDYLLIIITNQAGIGRGLYREEDFWRLTDWILESFKEQGIHIAQVYFSPFHPVDGIGKYKRDDISRKPKPGMIQQAQNDFELNLAQSILIGDKESDIEAGLNAGVKNNILFCPPEKNFPPDTKASLTIRQLADLISIYQQDECLHGSAGES